MGFTGNFIVFSLFSNISMKSLFRYSAFVLGIIYEIFLLLMAMDSFPVNGTWSEIEGYLIHSLPGLIGIIASVLGFYKPKYGFYTFLFLTVAFTFYFHTYGNIQEFLVVSFPPLIITMLLFVSSQKRKIK
jgi:hypothetical protein